MTNPCVKLAVAIVATVTTAIPKARAEPAAAAPTCPQAVRSAIDKLFPKAAIARCKAEREHGHDQFEVGFTRADGSAAEADVTPDGKLLQLEEKIELAKVPAAVMRAFAARYPKAKASAAEKQTPASGSPSYEIAFVVAGARKEATFTEAGKFVEEE